MGYASFSGGAPSGSANPFASTQSPLYASEKTKKNILVILVDDQGWKDLGCFGSTFYETPNIDGLAKTGMRFTDAYAACPVCSPTRASILSGKYPARINTADYFGGPQPERARKMKNWKRPLLPATYLEVLPLEETTLPEALKANGYATFFAGKWHLGRKGGWPENQGFDINRGGWTEAALTVVRNTSRNTATPI